MKRFFFCPHGPDDNCDCRKPKDAAFKELAHRLRINLDRVPAVGDSLRDIQAAQSAGARPILVRTGKGEKTLKKGVPKGVPVYDNLAAVADALLEVAI